MPTDSKLPANECDLVMKGGVTSGIVYPYAITKLKDSYTFASIGGTSAGAVAAAVVAAAEYGRLSIDEEGSDGFERMRALADDFSAQLFTRFGAPKGTRPILELLHATGAFGGRNKRRTASGKVTNTIRSLARFDTFGFGMGALIGIILGASLSYAVAGVWGWLASILPTDWVSSLNSGWGGWVLAAIPVVLGFVAGYLLKNLLGRLLNAFVGVAGGLLLLGIGWALDAWLGPGNWALLLAAFFTILLGTLGGVLGGVADLGLRVFTEEVPRNDMGIVNGHDPDYKRGQPVLLTDYLYEKLNDVAGMKWEPAPLTFGQLCGRTVPDKSGKPVSKSITLQMITTNVSQGIPYRLPFKSRIFLFRKEDMERLFPAPVVAHMVAHRYKSDTFVDELAEPLADAARPKRWCTLPPGYYFLPDPEDFPVVVAMRMSLAIPVFFSAVPFYTIKPSSFRKASQHEPLIDTDDLQKHFFSDGGTTSNFPIHSFDKWLPTRPTFGIDLSYMQDEPSSVGDQKVFANAVSLIAGSEGGEDVDDLASNPPPASESTAGEVTIGDPKALPATDWRDVDGSPFAFLMRVVDTARENHDNLQAALPGYRERIVTVRLTPEEGGMNLDMDPNIIRAMQLKGEWAGETFGEFDFDHHRWTRFLTLMSQLEIQLQKFKYAFKKRDYASLLVEDPGQPATSVEDFPYKYYANDDRRHKAYHFADSLIRLLDAWEAYSRGQFPDPDNHDLDLRQFVESGKAVPEHKETVAEQANCGPGEAGIDFYMFNQPPGVKDRVPKPRSVLRVTPDT